MSHWDVTEDSGTWVGECLAGDSIFLEELSLFSTWDGFLIISISETNLVYSVGNAIFYFTKID